MSNKIYKSKMKDENRLLGKFVNISLIALLIIFVLLFLKIIVTEISFHKMIAEMVEGIDYYIEDIVITDKETDRKSTRLNSSHPSSSRMPSSA